MQRFSRLVTLIPTTTVLLLCSNNYFFTSAKMAWRSHGRDNFDMVNQLKSNINIKLLLQLFLLNHHVNMFTLLPTYNHYSKFSHQKPWSRDDHEGSGSQVLFITKPVHGCTSRYSPHQKFECRRAINRLFNINTGIGYNVTISAPHMVHFSLIIFYKHYWTNCLISLQHAIALEALKDHLLRGNRALDVGSGSGYLTVCFAVMVIKCNCMKRKAYFQCICYFLIDRWVKKDELLELTTFKVWSISRLPTSRRTARIYWNLNESNL